MRQGFYGGLDIHANDAVGMPQSFTGVKPFQIPLGALIPKRVTNLLAACKNIGFTHITNGAYRLHPIEWNVGESAGALAAFALAQGVAPRNVASTPTLLEALQRALLAAGVPIFWWTDTQFGDPLFASIQMLGVREIVTGYDDMRFGTNDVLTQSDRAAIDEKVGTPLDWPSAQISRGDAASLIASRLG